MIPALLAVVGELELVARPAADRHRDSLRWAAANADRKAAVSSGPKAAGQGFEPLLFLVQSRERASYH